MAGRKSPRMNLGKVEPIEGGMVEAVTAMSDAGRLEIGRKTYNFVRRCMQDPVLRERIKARAEELRQIAAESCGANT